MRSTHPRSAHHACTALAPAQALAKGTEVRFEGMCAARLCARVADGPLIATVLSRGAHVHVGKVGRGFRGFKVFVGQLVVGHGPMLRRAGAADGSIQGTLMMCGWGGLGVLVWSNRPTQTDGVRRTARSPRPCSRAAPTCTSARCGDYY
jgi:hypothetical protein